MTRKISTTAAICCLSLMLGGCSLFGNFGKSGKSDQEAILPHDREQISASRQQPSYTSAELSAGALKGDWAIETVNGKNAIGEEKPFIKFAPEQKRIYGNNGCNVINASYVYNQADSTLMFKDVVSTMKACPLPGITDYEINHALESTRNYSWRLDDSRHYLSFYTADGREVMTLMHQNFEFLNGTWLVKAIDETAVNNPDMKLVIDIAEGKVHGNTGCNILNGSIETNMDTPNALSFQGIITTRMACPEPNHETQLIVALEEATYARPVSPTRVLLMDNNDQIVLDLVRTSDK